MPSIKKNFLFTASYQLANVLLLLVTAPYISRVLGAQLLGTYTYTYTVAGYFIIFAGLGFSLHGKRSIAEIKDDRAEVSRTFVEIYLIQFVSAVSVTVLYFLYVFLLAKNELRMLLLVQAFYVASSVFDISWLFFGMEKFKTISIRNFAIKFLTVLAMFLFVKTVDDVIVYAVIMACGMLFSQLVLWVEIPQIIDIKRKNFKFKISHLKTSLILFIPVVAVSLYTVMDKLMLGNISEMEELAFYENAYKVVSIPNGLITSFEIVMLPRMVNLTAREETNKVNKLLDESFSLVIMAGAPMMFGLAGVSGLLTSVMFGSEFEMTGYVMMILSFIIPLAAWAGVIRKEILIPRKMDREYIFSVFTGAIINLCFNLILIPNFGALGAACATVAAEASVFFYQVIVTRKFQPYGKYIKNNILFLIAAMIMGIVVYIISKTLPQTAISLVSAVLIGVVIYISMFVVLIKFTRTSFKDSLLFKSKGDN